MLKARHAITGFEVTAQTLKELGELLNVSGDVISRSIRSNTLTKSGFQCTYIGREWKPIKLTELELLKCGKFHAHSLYSDTHIIADSSEDMARLINARPETFKISASTIRGLLRRGGSSEAGWVFSVVFGPYKLSRGHFKTIEIEEPTLTPYRKTLGHQRRVLESVASCLQ